MDALHAGWPRSCPSAWIMHGTAGLSRTCLMPKMLQQRLVLNAADCVHSVDICLLCIWAHTCTLALYRMTGTLENVFRLSHSVHYRQIHGGVKPRKE